MGFKNLFKKNLSHDEKGDIMSIFDDKSDMRSSHKGSNSESKDGKPQEPVAAKPETLVLYSPKLEPNLAEEYSNGGVVTHTPKPLDADELSNIVIGTVYDADDSRVSKVKKSFTRAPLPQKRSLIILAIENTAEVNEYRTEVLRLTQKILDNNKDAFFLILRLGNQKQFFELFDYSQLNKEDIPNCLLPEETSYCEKVDLAEALTHICDFVNLFNKPSGTLEHTGKKYEITDTRIVFMGSGSKGLNKINSQEATELLKVLCSKKHISTIKYFCMKDEDAIEAATYGFPIIGHIESNFYK